MEVNRTERWGRHGVLVAHKMEQLVHGALELLVLLNTLLNALSSHRIDIGFDTTLDGILARVENKTQIVEVLLPKSLIGGQSRQYLCWNHIQDRLEEIEETNMVVLIRIQQLHVFHDLKFYILVREVELSASQYDY